MKQFTKNIWSNSQVIQETTVLTNYKWHQ